jgi:DNA invertase Pin-like site-specific DNA recombinase
MPNAKPLDRDLDRARQQASTARDFDASLDKIEKLHAERKRTRRAFSYIRFSSIQQAEGGSLTRQTRLSQNYCQRKGLVLDDSLTLRDLGVSAFRSDNVREGALAGFLEACRTGRVPHGSVLIVESLDRLSRDQIRPALQLFLALQDYGITIVILQPEREYPPDSTDALALIEPLIVFARAHEESAMKSHRRRDGWKQARERARQDGSPLMKTCPAWLEVTPAGFRIKEAAAVTVRRIYQMARDGLGVHRITETLTREKVPTIGTKKRWVKAYVYRILRSPAAMGTYEPQRHDGKKAVPDGPPIPAYYPAVVTAEEWREARGAVQARGGDFEENGRFRKGGKASAAAGRKSEQEVNLFTGLLHYALNGEKMHIVYALGRKGTGPRKRYVYLCPTQETGVPTRGRMDYAVFEHAILSKLRELRPSDIMADENHGNGREAEIARLSGHLLDLDSRLERARQRARTTKDFDAFLDLIQDLQTERKRVSEQLAELRQEEQAGHPSANLGEAHSLIDLLQQAPTDQRPKLRQRLKARIRQLIAEMWVLVVARGSDRLYAAQLWFRDGRTHRDYLLLYRPRKGNGIDERIEPLYFTGIAKPGDLDLRRRKDAAKLEALLASLDLTSVK